MQVNRQPEIQENKTHKRIPTANPKRLDRTRYAGYLELEPSYEDSGFFNLGSL